MKTKEERIKLAEAYLLKTSQHLFKRKVDGRLMKLIPFKKDEKLYYLGISISGDKTIIKATINDVEKMSAWYCSLSDGIFTKYPKHSTMAYTSTKHFRDFKRVCEAVKVYLEENKTATDNEITSVVIGLFESLVLQTA